MADLGGEGGVDAEQHARGDGKDGLAGRDVARRQHAPLAAVGAAELHAGGEPVVVAGELSGQHRGDRLDPGVHLQRQVGADDPRPGRDGLGEIVGRQDGIVKVKVGDEVFDAPRLLIASGSEALVPPIPLLALSLLFEGPGAIPAAMQNLTLIGAGSLLFISYAATLFGYGTWSMLLSRYPAGLVAPFSLLVPIAGIGSAALLLGEAISGIEVAGSVLVFAGLLLNVFGPRLLARRGPGTL